jgi:hypothetical protein
VKARLNVWQEKVQQAEEGAPPDNSKVVEERIAEVGFLSLCLCSVFASLEPFFASSFSDSVW